MNTQTPLPEVRPWRFVWLRAWPHRASLHGWAFPVVVFVVGLVTVAAPYFISNALAARYLDTCWDPGTALDASIPAVNWMIFPYAAFYLLFPATILAAPRNDRGRTELAVGLQVLSLATWCCVAVFLLMPAEVDLRDQLTAHWQGTPPSELEASLFAFVHESDAPWNAWPSLHIVHSLLLVMMMTRWIRRDRGQRTLATALLCLLWSEWLLLCVSVLTTKQHFIFDLASGLVVGLAFWWRLRSELARLEGRDPSAWLRPAG